MISKWLQILLSDDYAVKGMVPEDVNASYFKNQSRSLKLAGVNSEHIKDVIKHIKDNKRFAKFKAYLGGIQKDYLYKSEIHGLAHNERVALFAFYLADKLWLDDNMSYSTAQNEFLLNKGSLSKVVDVKVDNNTAILTVVLVPKKVYDMNYNMNNNQFETSKQI